MGIPMTETTTACRPDDCLAEDWLGFLGHRWNALLLWHLSGGPKRFSELQALLPRISPKVAAMPGRDLLRREETNTYPREVTYALTPRAEGLRGILSDLYDWAATIAEEEAAGADPRPGDTPAERQRSAGATRSAPIPS